MRTLQVELSELKRVYQDLQEENESYEILLGEKTLNGEVRDTDFFRRSSLWGDELVPAHSELEPVGELHESGGEEDGEEDEDEDEEDEDEGEVDVDAFLLESQGTGSFNSGAVAAGPPSGGRRKRPIAKSNGGGLDLAAELEAAQIADQEEKEPERKKKQTKKEKGLVAEIDGMHRLVLDFVALKRFTYGCLSLQSSRARSSSSEKRTRPSRSTSPRSSTASAARKASRKSSPSTTASRLPKPDPSLLIQRPSLGSTPPNLRPRRSGTRTASSAATPTPFP